MASRNYAPKLLFLLRQLCKYIRKYQPQLETFVGPDHLVALTNVISACETMEDVLSAFLPPIN